MNIGIKQIREKLGLTQKEFAEKLGVKPSAISNYESHFRAPRQKLAYKILDLAKSKGFNFDLNNIYPREF